MKMKRYWMLFALLIVCLLAGCSSKAGDTQEDEPAMSETELHQLFQEVFDAHGDASSAEESQIAAELAALAEAAGPDALPEGYEALYQSWRSEQLAAQGAQLQAEYEKILSEAPLYLTGGEGACTACYADLDGSGEQELLIVYLEAFGPDDPRRQIWFEVYGEDQGHAKKIAEEHVSSVGRTSMGLCGYDGHACIYTGEYNRGQDALEQYYVYENQALTLTDSLYQYAEFGLLEPQESPNDQYTSFDQPISKAEFDAAAGKYTDQQPVVWLEDGVPYIEDRGVLPELPPEAAWKSACLEALNGAYDAVYATLLDVNDDGLDELAILYENNDQLSVPKYYFRVYSWDGSQVVPTDYSRTANEEHSDYLKYGFSLYGIYREKDTGKVYFCYSGEIAGGWGGHLFLNGQESVFFSEPFWGEYDDPDAGIYDEEGLRKAYADYQAQIDQRFEKIVGDFNAWNDLPDYDSIEAVKQQLQNG